MAILGLGSDYELKDPLGIYKDAPGLGQRPSAPAGGFSVPESYYENARQSESGGNRFAKNSKSSATGDNQFLESTWNELARRRPDLQLTPDGRTDTAQSARAMRAFTEENAAVLHAKGLPVDNGTLYAAHFLGAGGATTALRAPDTTPMASLVSDAVVAANPFLADMTAGEFKSWAARKGGAGAPSAVPSQPGPSRAVGKADTFGGVVIVDDKFAPADPMGLYQGVNPFRTEQAPPPPAAAAPPAQPTGPDPAEEALAALQAKNPGRYKLLDETELEQWKADWEEQNRSGGMGGDTARLLAAGWAGLGLAAREAVGAIPKVGPSIVNGLDAVDQWMRGDEVPAEQYLQRNIEKNVASLTPDTAAARGKEWVTETPGTDGSVRYGVGPAWSDPRSYYSGLVESIPATVVSMAPGMLLARGSFLAAVAGGASTKAAAAAAARTATIAGGIAEGILGGGQASRAVRDQIAAMPRESLAQSEAVKQLVAGGMTFDDAVKALTDDAATQAFVLAGAATGAFGGLGDRALAKILAEGVGGGFLKRIVAGGARGAVAEGVLEEAPQEAASQAAQNKALQTIDPSQRLMEGVPGAAAGGLAVGGAMGAGFGGAGGAARPGEAVAAPPAGEMPEPVRKGPLTAALEHGEREAVKRAPPAPAAIPEGAYPVGTTVRVEAPGIEPFMAAIDSYADGEAVLFDSASGEIYQVPLDAITPIAAAGMPSALTAPPADDVSNLELLEPAPPMAATVTTDMPPAAEQKPALERFPAPPQAGERVIVDAPGIARFAGRIERYEDADGQTEAIVVDDAGTPMQVPVENLYVSKLGKKDIEQQDLARDPPVDRDPVDPKTPGARRIGDKTVVMPDDRHARLFDLGRERQVSQKLAGASSLDRDAVMPAAQSKLAEEFGVTPEALGQMADDYRYRVERAGKEARSKLPVKMHPVNERRLKQWQSERRRADAKLKAAPEDDLAMWWDGELSGADRKAALEKAGIKRSERTMWGSFPKQLQAKLAEVRGGAPVAMPGPNVAEQPVVDNKLTGSEAPIDTAVHAAATSPRNDLPEPTAAQKEAGNYAKGHVRIGGLDISIENPEGSTRSGKSRSGKTWSVTMKSHYGYIRGTVGRDKDHIDVFVKPGVADMDDDSPVFVVDQVSPGGKFDEHKVMLGFGSEKEAESAYRANYAKGWKGLGTLTPTTLGDFKAWLAGGQTSERFAQAEPPTNPRQKGPDVQINSIAAIHEAMADRVSPKEFVASLSSDQTAAVIDPQGKLWVLKASTNPAGDHAEFFGRLIEADLVPYDKTGYVRVTGYSNQIGIVADEPTAAQTSTISALKALGSRSAVNVIGDDGTSNKAATEPAPLAEPVDVSAPNSDPVAPETAQPEWGAGNKLVTADRAAEVRKKLREKLRGQLNSGIDPELLALGTELAAFHIEAGARRFAAFARAIAKDMDTSVEKLRPFLRAWYNGARDLMEDSGLDIAGTDDADAVRAALADLKEDGGEPAKLGGSGPTALEAAPPGEVRGVAGGRDAGEQPAIGGGADVTGSDPARAERDPAGRSVADGAGGVSPAPAGEPAGPGRVAVAQDGAGRDGGPARDEDLGKPASYPASAATPAPLRAVDYTLTDADELGVGGSKAKFRQNMAAVRVLRTLEAEARPATSDEQAVLAKWVGWGGLRAAFPREDGSVTKGWDKEAAALKDLLTPEEYRAAEASTRNAHYTAPEVVKAIWDVASRLGFTGGQVLEPSVGAGNFIGLMPGKWRKAARVTGVELDRITGGIAKNLYPLANIQAPKGFQDLTIPDGYFDLVIGNPPFGSERLYDVDRRHLNKFSIHNFFFAKAVDALKPGGVLAMVVTNYFLDAADAKARAYIAARADLVGAIRLPNNAFLKNAGTEVTTDIIVLQKRAEGTPSSDVSWVESTTLKDKEGRTVPINRYFKKHPEMMLGEFGAYGTMYRGDEAALVARPDDDLPTLLATAIRSLPERIMAAPGSVVVPETVTVPKSVEDALVGSLFIDDQGAVYLRKPDSIGLPQAEPVTFPSEAARQRVAGMIRVRDAFARLRRAQIDENATDAKIEALRQRLNQNYDAFVRTHGPINADANRRLFRDDPTWPQISALEEGFDKGISATVAKSTGETARGPSARKAPIFTKRTQQPYRRPSSAASAKDALATVLADTGRVDIEAMSRLYKRGADQIIDELGNLLFRTPSGDFETADQYLSGNVKAKLAQAERAAATDPAFRRNVAALRDVIPADIEAVDIDVKPGAPWLPPGHVADFVEHVAEKRGARAFYSRANARWALEVPNPSPAADAQWTTDRTSLAGILDAVMNGQSMTVYDRTSDGKAVLNQPATDAANEKAEKLKAEWRRWLWQDDSRREELTRLYNDTFNTDVLRRFDGSHLTLPGKVGDDIISLRPHQKNFVWRALQSSTALADHVVGAGKTFAVIASVMEMRRIGQARKPMLVVPNHLVGQWAADFIKLYPGAKVLAATKKDFEAENRKRLFARVATGDWDAVIVAHSSFGRIGVNPEFEQKFIQDQLEELEASIRELRAATGEKSRNVAQLSKWRETMQGKLQRLLDAGAKDNGLTFDEMGVDALVVDEAHEFKNLAFATSMTRVAGLGNAAGSQKAADLYMKVLSVMERTGGRNIIFATGTPLSNTMAEMYTVQRYLDGKSLRDLGVQHFDAWARVFGEVVSDWELSPSGQYKLNSRFAKFVNMPELMQRYLSFADVITNDDIKAQLAAVGKTLPLPKVKGGKPQNIVVERSADQARYIGVGTQDQYGNLRFPEGSLVHRAENLPKRVEKGADNMLKVMSDARKAALDMRLISPSYPDVPGSKVHIAADNIKRIYDRWHPKLGTQLVFIDLSTPKKAKAKEEARLRELMKRAEAGDEAAQETLDNMSPDEFTALDSPFSVYDDLREKLINRGVPPAEIAFIHDANTDAQKEELFGKVRSGRVRILFGSTAKMGAGTNVQNRLVALHHLDAPWRPSDLEQRDGRGIRQGNELYGEDPAGFEIEILRYATKNTLDARQWQTIEGKARFISQVRKGGMKTREIEDIAGEAANAAEMKAAASGNPLILEEMDLRQRLRRLEGQSAEHDREQHRIRARVRAMEQERERNSAKLAAAEADAATAAAARDGDFVAVVEGTSVDKPKDFGAAVLASARSALKANAAGGPLGTYSGFALSLDFNHTRSFTVRIKGAGEHEVYIDDVAEADPVGTAMRITNTVRRLGDEPKRLRDRNDEIATQIPALERQIAPWPDAEKLKETAARHNAVLTELRPKQTPASPAPATPAAQASVAPAGWDMVEAEERPTLSEADQRRVRDIIQEVAGIDDVTFMKRIDLPNGAPGWGSTGPSTAGGFYQVVQDAITVSLEAVSGERIAYHEAFHRLQRLFLTAKEREVLAAEVGRLRRIVSSSIGREAQSMKMSQSELEAEAFAIYSTRADGGLRPHSIVRAAWDRVSTAMRRVRNFLAGKGFQTAEDVFDSARSGETRRRPVADRPAAPVQYSLTENRIVEEVSGKLVDLQPHLLKAIPLNYFAELARPTMTAVGEYLRVKRLLDAYRGKKHAAADAVAQEWLKFSRLGYGKAGRAKAAALADLMHAATLAGVDPSKTDDETSAQPGYADLRRQFMALPPAGRTLFVKVRDAYSNQADELDRILLDNVRKAQEIAQKRAEAQYKDDLARIAASKMSPMARRDAEMEASARYTAQQTRSRWSMKARLTKMRIAFEASRVEQPYFPLARFGRYFVTVRDVDGTVLSFSRRESAADRDRLAADMRKAYPNAEVEVGVTESGGDLRSAMDPRIVAEIEEIIGGAGLDGDTMNTVLDQIWQRYLASMPDLSVRKRFIHRKGTAGFDADALRAFSSHMFHAAHQMGRLKYGMELQELTSDASDQARKSDDPTKGMTLANELRHRHKWVMNPTGSAVAQTMTSAAFVWYLAGSPASAIVNMAQTPMLGIPILAGRFGGFAKASAAILKASMDSVAGRGSVGRANLSKDEMAALDAFYESGLIDRTQSHDLAGVGETGVDYSPLRTRVMATLSFLFHRAEVWNREVTALAAYRLAVASGQNHMAAVDTAHDLTWKTHFDYSNSSRPRVLQSDIAKVALVFRAHNINMLYRVLRDIRQTFKGETPQARREARYQLAGIFGMMSLFAGVTGTLGFNLAMALAGVLFGDDDDPMDFEQKFRKDVLDVLGPELGGIVLSGAPGHYLGIDLTARIGMPDIWFRSPNRDLQGKDEYEYWVMNSLGASVSMLGDVWNGVSLLRDGDVTRGVEALVPKWARDPLKAFRYMNEGLTTFKGDSMIGADEMDPWNIIAQSIGFTPAKVAETFDRNNALKNAEQRILDRRRSLMNAFALAISMGDDEERQDVIRRIKAFNAAPANKALAITPETLRRSLAQRKRLAAKREDGVLIQNQELGKRLRDMLPEAIYR